MSMFTLNATLDTDSGFKKLPAHALCVDHVSVEGRKLCFADKATPAAIKRRLAFEAQIARSAAKHHAQEAKRPIGDGLVSDGNGDRVRPSQIHRLAVAEWRKRKAAVARFERWRLRHPHPTGASFTEKAMERYYAARQKVAERLGLGDQLRDAMEHYGQVGYRHPYWSPYVGPEPQKPAKMAKVAIPRSKYAGPKPRRRRRRPLRVIATTMRVDLRGNVVR